MPGRQLVGLQHAVALADGDHAAIEGKLQRALRGLPARPEMFLLGQHVVIDVADGERTGAHQPHHLAGIGRRHRREPFVAVTLVRLHRRQEEADVLGRDVGQRMRPVFEHALLHALRLLEVGAAIIRNAGEQDVVMAALDHVDGVDLHIAEMVDGRGHGRSPLAERRPGVEPLRAQPDAAGISIAQRKGYGRAGHFAAM